MNKGNKTCVILIKKGSLFIIDNFIKMILIYLRIIENIPLILMDGTWFGKTSLIKFLFPFIIEWYNLIKINIHSGQIFTHIEKKTIYMKKKEEPI